MKNKTILISYLNKEAAIASAMILRKYPQIEHIITSTGKFPEELESILINKEITLIVVGFGFYDRVADVIKILDDRAKGNRIIWINEVIGLDKITKRFKEIKTFKKNGDNLIANTLEFLGDVDEFSDLLRIQNDYESKGNIIIESAIYRAINFRDYNIFPDIIRSLAEKKLNIPVNLDASQFREYFGRTLVGKSKEMLALRKLLLKAGKDNHCKILINGESGTGKGTMAYLIHFASERRKMPFFTVSCTNFHGNLLDSELFGFEKGAFTGADKTKKGLVELAGDGTLFLDEIGDMPLNVQAKFLRVLQDKKYIRIGGTKAHDIRSRIVTATNKDLKELVRKGEFREDLYYRIAEVEISSIPLREHPEDIELIGNSILFKLCEKRNIKRKRLNRKNIDVLEKYDWPGNVRELENALTKALVLGDWSFGFLKARKYNRNIEISEIKSLKEYENEYIRTVYEQLGKHKNKTASKLGVAPNTLRARLTEMGLE